MSTLGPSVAITTSRLTLRPLASLPDPGDLPFIEVAVAAAVDAIVTGNVKHFRPAEGRLDLAVMTPRQCLDWFSGRDRP